LCETYEMLIQISVMLCWDMYSMIM
jgi:hypothetical protein